MNGFVSYREIFRLSWPLALGMINNAVMQMVDRIYLSHESQTSLEAVLPAGVLAGVFVCFFLSLVGYSGTFVAQYHGAGDSGRVVASYRAGRLLALASGVATLLLTPLGGIVFPTSFSNPEVAASGDAYYRVAMAGAVFLFGQMAAASYFTGLGRTRIVFAVNLVGNLFNIALDPFLIFGWCGLPRLGITGAAAATVVAQAVQWAVLAVAARRDLGQCAEERSENLLRLVGRILRYGAPSGAYSALNLLSFAVFVFVTAGVGDVALAASNASFTVNYLLIAPMEGFALGAATLVGQAQGSGDSAAASAAGRRTLALALIFVTVLSLLAVAFNRPILALFAPADPVAAAEFHDLGFTLFLLMAAWQIFDAADVVLSGALKGAGDTKFVMWWMLAVAFGLWLPLVFAVRSVNNTMPALWGTMIVYVAVLCVGTGLRWVRGRWKGIRLV